MVHCTLGVTFSIKHKRSRQENSSLAVYPLVQYLAYWRRQGRQRKESSSLSGLSNTIDILQVNSMCFPTFKELQDPLHSKLHTAKLKKNQEHFINCTK